MSSSSSSSLPGWAEDVVMLEANYRSHHELLKVPSELFYDGRLEERADRSATHSLLAWEGLPTRTMPLLFYGIQGIDMAELDSPSYFNLVEASTVVDLVQRLLTSKKVAVQTSDIGIIAAFRRQVLKLRKLLRVKGLGSVNVGQVEDFQGSETKVIIVSTVLARPAFMHRIMQRAA